MQCNVGYDSVTAGTATATGTLIGYVGQEMMRLGGGC